jgi:hypothetical protein
VQTGVGIEHGLGLAANEVSVTPVQAGASIEQEPVLAADEISTPVQTGVGIEHDPVLATDEVLTPVQTGVDIELPSEEASASLQLWVPIADGALASPVSVGVSTDVSAQALPITEFIHGEPEPVVVGPLQPLPFLTVNELVPLYQSMPPDSSFLCLPSNDDASPILPPFAEHLEKLYCLILV